MSENPDYMGRMELMREVDRLREENADLRATVCAARIRLPVRPEAALLILSGEVPTLEREDEVRKLFEGDR